MINAQKIIIVSGPVIIENGAVLLNKHGDDDFWKFLGGKVELKDIAGENVLEDTCKREVKEENGFDIEIIYPLKPMMIKKPGSKNEFVVLIHFLARRKNKKNKLGSDISEFGKFNIKKLVKGAYKEKFAPNIIPILKNYLELKRRKIL